MLDCVPHYKTVHYPEKEAVAGWRKSQSLVSYLQHGLKYFDDRMTKSALQLYRKLVGEFKAEGLNIYHYK